MKEVRSRDPARRMTLRYDKLYIGNDIFFVNDRTRRVERLHQHVDAGTTSYYDSQVSCRAAIINVLQTIFYITFYFTYSFILMVCYTMFL